MGLDEGAKLGISRKNQSAYDNLSGCVLFNSPYYCPIATMKKFGLLCCLLISGLISQAQAPKYSNDFLAIGVGARAMALGSGTVAGLSDATATYWNPSAILQQKNRWQGSLMHAAYFGGIANYDFAAITHQLDDRNAIGLNFIRLGIDNIQNTLNLYDANGNINYNNISMFSAADYAFGLTYAHKLENGWQLGSNAKIIRRIIGPFANAWGFGLDVGISKNWNRLQFGLMARDITSTFNAWSFNTAEFADVFRETGNELPQNSLEITLPRLMTGVAYLFDLPYKFQVRPEFSLEILTDGPRNNIANLGRFSIDPRLSLEVNYARIVYFRTGINNIQRTIDFCGEEKTSVQPNFGLGLQFKRFGIDYAITNVGERSRTFFSNILSVNVNI